MLTFEEKKKIIESFSELTRHDVSLHRVNYHYEESHSDKKVVIYHYILMVTGLFTRVS